MNSHFNSGKAVQNVVLSKPVLKNFQTKMVQSYDLIYMKYETIFSSKIKKKYHQFLVC